MSREYLPVQIVAEKNGNTYNPTGDTVQIAVPVKNVEPVSGDWINGGWTTEGTNYFARVVIGPGGDKVLTPGTYDVYVKITDSPEVPVIVAGKLIIT